MAETFDVEHIGIVGGGQLGRMLAQAAIPLGFEVTVTNPGENGPAAQVGAHEIVAPLDDTDALDELSSRVDVITWEIEHIPAGYLKQLEERGVNVQPSPATLEMIQDKLVQKETLRNAGIPVAPFTGLADPSHLGRGPYVVKSRKGGFDGRGNMRLQGMDEAAIQERFRGSPTYVEKAVAFSRELAVIVARDQKGKTAVYPVVETEHENDICHTVISPPENIDPRILEEAQELGHDVLDLLNGAGVFAIEMFLGEDGLMVNEIAPRVHNSGHLTIEANATSQFEQHIRAVSGLPLGPTDLIVDRAAMVNILGKKERSLTLAGIQKALAMHGVYVHLYGKEPKPGRKIGHITAVERQRHSPGPADRAKAARDALKI